VAVAVPSPSDLAARDAELAAADGRVVIAQQKRAEAGCAHAQFELALRYAAGRGVPVDKDVALICLKQATLAEHQQACKLTEAFVGK